MASFRDFLDVLKDDLLELGKQQLQEHADALFKAWKIHLEDELKMAGLQIQDIFPSLPE